MQVSQESRLSIRLPAAIKERIEHAAMLSGMSVTEFTISNLAETADEIIERHHVRTVSNRDRDIILALLDEKDDPKKKPNKKLVEAFKAMKELIAE